MGKFKVESACNACTNSTVSSGGAAHLRQQGKLEKHLELRKNIENVKTFYVISNLRTCRKVPKIDKVSAKSPSSANLWANSFAKCHDLA